MVVVDGVALLDRDGGQAIVGVSTSVTLDAVLGAAVVVLVVG